MWLQILLGHSRLESNIKLGGGQLCHGQHNAAAAGPPAEVTTSTRASPRSIEFRTGTPRNESGDEVEVIAMIRMEEGGTNLKFQSVTSTKWPATEIETVSRTEVAQ